MGYLGNPKMVMVSQDSIPIANFEYPADPTVTSNPTRVPVSWLNTLTGKIWVCTDNTTDANVWVIQGGGQYSAAMQEGGNSTVYSGGVWTDIAFDTLVHEDATGIVDLANNKLIIPSGCNRFSANMFLQADSSTEYFSLRIQRFNSSDVLQGSVCEIYTPNYAWMVTTVSGGPEASAEGDYLKASIYPRNGNLINWECKLSGLFWTAPV